MNWVKSHWKLLAIALAVVVAAVVLIVVLAGGKGGDKGKDATTDDNPATTDSGTSVAAEAPKATTPPEQFEYSKNDDGTIVITGYNGNEKELVIPSVIEGTTVTRIGYGALQYSSNITSIVVPEGVKTINSLAFAGIDTLKDVWLPASLESCDRDSFGVWEDTYWTTPYWLTYHVLPNTYAQHYCTDELLIAEVTPENQGADERLYLGEFSYSWIDKSHEAISVSYNGKASVVTVPASINGHPVKQTGMIGWYSTAFDSSVKQVIFPEGLESIGDGAFRDCSNLESVTIPASVTYIGNGAFAIHNSTGWSDTDPKLTIIVSHGSYAEKYFQDNPDEHYVITYSD